MHTEAIPSAPDAPDALAWEAEPIAAVPYLYIDKVLNELRDELLSAMHAALEREMRNGKVDVPRLYRAFTRAAANKVANPVLVSDRCLESNTSRPKKGSSVRE